MGDGGAWGERKKNKHRTSPKLEMFDRSESLKQRTGWRVVVHAGIIKRA